MDEKSNTAIPPDGPAGVQTLPDLICLRAPVSNGALKSAELPKRVKIFDWGTNPSTKGPFQVGAKSVEQLGARQRALGFERVALDYNHCSVPGSPEYEKLLKAGQPPIIFGYGRPAVVPGEGMFLEDMEWTPLGVEKARNFEDLSPAASAESGEVDFVHSVALTTNGCLYDVTFFSANLAEGGGTQDERMSEKNNNAGGAGVITLALLSGALGLAATATEAEVSERIKKLNQLSALEPLAELVKDGKVVILETVSGIGDRVKTLEAAATKGIAALSATVDGKVVTLNAEDLVKLSARVDTLQASIDRQAGEVAESERTRLVLMFATDGKVPKDADGRPFSSDALKKMDVPTLRLLHANTPAMVPMSARRQAQEGNAADPNAKGRARMIAAFDQQNAARR